MIYILALLLLSMLVLWILTADFENSSAFQWMTNTTKNQVNPNLEMKVFNGGQFGVLKGDSTPVWIAADAMNLTEGDSVIFDQRLYEKSYRLEVRGKQMPLWNDYLRHLHHWAAECDTMYVVYGQLPDSNAIYTINLCIAENSKGQAVIIPDKISKLPFFNFTHAIDKVERISGIDFFADLLDAESEAYIEDYHQRLQWLYPPEFYNKRLEENKTITNGNK